MNYRLTAAIIHLGNANGGHYITCKRGAVPKKPITSWKAYTQWLRQEDPEGALSDQPPLS